MKGWNAIDKALSGEGGNSDPAVGRIVHWVRGNMFGAAEPAPDQTQAFEALLARLKSQNRLHTSSRAGTGYSRRYSSYVRYLAGLGLLATVLFVGWRINDDTRRPAVGQKVYTTANAQRATVALPDGSRAILGPATTIRVNDRNVQLQGEAVFTVVHHVSNPFTVRTANTVTQVIGTTFGIKAYDGNVRLAVQDGKVVFEGIGISSKSVLAAGDIAAVANGKLRVQHNVDVAAMLGWTNGKLVFHDARLRDIIPDIERAFDLDVDVSDSSLLNKHITATITGDRLTESQLTLIGAALDAQVIREGRRLTLRSAR